MVYTKNSDPNFYYHNEFTTNCGSYALNIKEWYEVDFDIQKEALDLVEKGFSDSEIYELVTRKAADLLLKEFKGELTEIDAPIDTKNNEELIAFRIGLEEWNDYEADFHFRVYRNGVWKEKCGAREIQNCNFEEDAWETGLIYEGPIVYFLHKIR